MTRFMKSLICIALSFMFVFMCVGYAALSDNISITGTAESTAQTGVFILDVELPENNSANLNSALGTVLNTRVDLSVGGNVTLGITLYNNSPYEYAFNGTKYTEGAGTYDNTSIKFELSGLKKGDKIGEAGSIKFDITFSYAGSASVNSVLNSVLNFEFIPGDEYIPEIAAINAMTKFEEILNDTADYTALITQMDNYSGNRNNSSYIGNVVGGTQADTKLLNDLFTENGENHLKLNIGGVETDVTCMVKRENVDGIADNGDGSGNEMTIYMTAANLSNASWFTDVTVYAVVFAKDKGGSEWYQLGQLYEGTARVNNYDGSLFGARNSFNTDTWETRQSYYNLAGGATIEEVIAAYKKEATAAN